MTARKPFKYDLTGRTFGRLTVMSRLPRPTWNQWLCQCSCGKQTTSLANVLLTGRKKSCGCYSADASRERERTHGRARTPEYRVWNGMLMRCENTQSPAYKSYGGRGIKVCDRWHCFQNFFEDMGPRPAPGLSLDRINNDGNYEPGNVRWATAKQQAANRRPRYGNKDGAPA